MTEQLRGVITPLLTPFNDDGSLALDLYVAHARWVLGQGSHFLSPFGTTGEALSVSLAERKAALEALVEGGIPAARLMPGTGLCSLPETAELSAHAVGLGCAAVMTLPPFFFKSMPEDGFVRYFAALIERIGDPKLKICLYHIPPQAVVGFPPSLAGRLARNHPDTVVAYKDSSGDWQNMLAIRESAPGLALFPGTEMFLTEGLAAGAAGCISATCNLNAAAIRAVFDGASGTVEMAADELARRDAEMKAFRQAVQKAGMIGAMKAALAVRTNEDRWLNLRPPHLNATRAAGEALLAELGPMAGHIGAHEPAE